MYMLANVLAISLPSCACGEATAFILGSSFTSHCMKCFPTCILVDSTLASASHAYF